MTYDNYENFDTKKRFMDLLNARLITRRSFATRIGVHVAILDSWIEDDFIVPVKPNSLSRNIDKINQTIIEIEKESGIYKDSSIKK